MRTVYSPQKNRWRKNAHLGLLALTESHGGGDTAVNTGTFHIGLELNRVFVDRRFDISQFFCGPFGALDRLESPEKPNHYRRSNDPESKHRLWTRFTRDQGAGIIMLLMASFLWSKKQKVNTWAEKIKCFWYLWHIFWPSKELFKASGWTLVLNIVIEVFRIAAAVRVYQCATTDLWHQWIQIPFLVMYILATSRMFNFTNWREPEGSPKTFKSTADISGLHIWTVGFRVLFGWLGWPLYALLDLHTFADTFFHDKKKERYQIHNHMTRVLVAGLVYPTPFGYWALKRTDWSVVQKQSKNYWDHYAGKINGRPDLSPAMYEIFDKEFFENVT